MKTGIAATVAGPLVMTLLLPGVCSPGPADGLVGHWKLEGDCRDSSGQGHHGVNHGVEFDGGEGGEFNGVDSYVEVPSSPSLVPAHGPFSIAVSVYTEAEQDDILGDVLSKYDPATRTGLTLAIQDHAGASSSQANSRNLSFGIDAARIDCEWTDRGRPGKSRHVCSMAVFQGKLYAGTLEPGRDDAGHVFRHDGGSKWTDCGRPDRCNAVFALAVYEGNLYAGVARRDTTHDGQAPSPNGRPGGKVYRYEGGERWTDCGRLGNADSVYAMAVYRGKLYATTLYWPAKGLYRYDGGTKWTFCGHPGQRVEPLAVHNGYLYAASFDGGEFFRYDGRTWTRLKPIPDTTQTYSIAIYQGRIHVGTWPNGKVFRYEDSGDWTFRGRLGDEQEIQAMLVYNGKLFAGTLPSAKVCRHVGDTTWSYTGHLDEGEGIYRRAWTLAVCDGKLFCGTMPSGRVWSLEAGRCATYDSQLAPGWRHIVAVKGADRLKLYVDGKCVSTSSSFQSSHYDLANPAPLKIGLGERDYFNGKLNEIRIYNRALNGADVSALHRASR